MAGETVPNTRNTQSCSKLTKNQIDQMNNELTRLLFTKPTKTLTWIQSIHPGNWRLKNKHWTIQQVRTQSILACCHMGINHHKIPQPCDVKTLTRSNGYNSINQNMTAVKSLQPSTKSTKISIWVISLISLPCITNRCNQWSNQ